MGSQDCDEGFLAFSAAGTCSPATAQAMVTSPGRPVSSSSGSSAYCSRRDASAPDGSLNKVKFACCDKTFCLAPKPGPDADREIKSLAFQDCVSEIEGSSAAPKEKTVAPTSHWNAQSMKTASEQVCAALKDPTSPRFNWVFGRCLGQDFADLGAPAGGHIPNGTVCVSHDAAIAPPAGLSTAAATTSKAGIRIRLCNDPANVANLHPNCTDANIIVFNDMCRACIDANNPALIPAIGIDRSTENPFSAEHWTEFVESKCWECVFEVAVASVRRAAIGDTAIRTAAQRFDDLKMTRHINGKQVTDSVQMHFDKAQVIINEMPVDIHHSNLTAAWFHNLDESVKHHLINNENCAPPDAPQPSNVAEINSLLTLKEPAAKAESELKQRCKQVVATVNSQRGRNSNSFLAAPATPAATPPMNDAAALMGFPSVSTPTSTLCGNTTFFDPNPATHGTCGGASSQADIFTMMATQPNVAPWIPNDMKPPPVPTASVNLISPAEMHSAEEALKTFGITEDEECVDVLLKAVKVQVGLTALMSAAEKSLREASGSKFPIECWGCKDDPRFHDKRMHRFIDCPDKTDPQVRARANKEMTRIFGDKNKHKKRNADTMVASALSPDEIQQDWKKLGFNSAEQAEMVCTLISRDTSTRNRKRCRVEDKSIPSSDSATMNLMFVPTEIPMVVQGIPTAELNAAVTRHLPHVQLGFADGKQTFTIKAAADSCAGVSLGHLGCHRAVHALFPESVVQFREIADSHKVQIGGVGDGGLTITHEITCRMVCRADGSEVRLTFGLSEDAACSAVVGVPFFEAA